ncbi:DUF5694 domain-containing protein [Zunongwangia endophytica]|uniref:DUF5694 domain-containing protein n=1 Tax=Zunongwangia endophytica TaxID=1808945 RepID=A0ABV8H6D3_9FLAO|nr:DUF5694 domain-containing protein [Zunongwangia endophytica]MDN3596090.1 DUF5694 domain-containing protein [Zunongwangia endophytica]
MKKIINIFIFIALSQISFGQQKEVLLIGTMHKVPKIVRHSYKPLLKRAVKYQPEAIYVETPHPNDSISWEYLKDGWSNSYKEFYSLSDSLQKHYNFDQYRFQQLLKKDFNALTPKNLQSIITSFAYLRDYANYDFYSYIQQYGIKGSSKPTRHEDGDLTAKLALQLNIKKLQSMDDQQTNKEYHQAWQNCAKDGGENGDNEINRKLNKKHYNKAIVPALFGRLGFYVNKRKSLKRLDQLASFSYVKNQTESCLEGLNFWNRRNHNMAQNIGSQIVENSATRSVVIVGAAHIYRIEKELKANFPEITVLLLNDL